MLGLNDFYLEEDIDDHIDEHQDLQASHDDHIDHPDFSVANTTTLYAGTASIKQVIAQSAQAIGSKYIDLPGLSLTEAQGYNQLDSQIFSAASIGTSGVLPLNEKYLDVANETFLVKQGAGGPEIIASVPISAPNILASTHSNTDGHVVERNTTNGVHLSNLVVEAEAPFTNNEGYAPGLNFDEGQTQGFLNILGDGALHFYPYTNNGDGTSSQVTNSIYRLGKAEVPRDDGRGDGILLQRPYNGAVHQVELGVHPELPNLRITSDKHQDHTAFIECRDSSGSVVFGVTKDGHVVSTNFNQDDLSKIPDQIAHSIIAENRSIYIGQMRISWMGNREHVSYLQQIPGYLVATYATGQNDLVRPAADYTVRQWLVYARTLASDPTLKVSTLFPAQYDSDWTEAGLSFAHTLTSDAQSQFDVLMAHHVQTAVDIYNSQVDILENTQAIADLEFGDTVVEDESVYIGSLKYSFKRNTREPKLKILKDDHIPVWLSAQGYTNTDLPSGKSRNDMSIAAWIKSARTFLSDSSLKVKDVFPSNNADFDLIDAHIPAALARIAALEALDIITAAEQAKLAAVTLQELTYCSGLTSAAQTQITTLDTARGAHDTRITTLENAGGGASNPILLTSSVANTPAKITLENSAVNGTTEFEVSKLTDKDRTWRFKTHNQDELKLECDQGQYGIQQSFRIAKNGNVCILGQGQSTNEVGSYTFRTMGSVLFEHDKFVCSGLLTSDPGVANRIYNDNTNLRISSGTADEPVVRSTSHENPGGYTNWSQLPFSCSVLSIEQAQTCRRRLPLNPKDGHEIKIIFPLGTGTLNIHTGAHVNSGVYRQVYYKSTGYASQYQCNINATSVGDLYTCIFIEATNKWFLK
jgi:hypothetical protein